MKALQHDEYRTTLFKRKLRGILGADLIRFYYSQDRSRLWLTRWHLGEKNLSLAAEILRENEIEFEEEWDRLGLAKMFGREPELDGIGIAIDQEALPERKRRVRSGSEKESDTK